MVRGGGSGRGFAPDVIEASRRSDAVRIAPAGAAHDGDAFGLDLAFHQRVAPLFQFLFERYWRVEAMGLHNVPSDGPILFVSNHSGALPFDGAMIATALFKHDQRVVRFLYDRFVTNVGPVDAFYRRVGGVPAARENALELLKRNEQVVIFPEGVSGVAKPFSDRYRLFRTRFRVSYGATPDQLEAFSRRLREVVDSHQATVEERTQVGLSQLADGGIEFDLVCYFRAETADEERGARHELLLQIMRLAEEIGVKFKS